MADDSFALFDFFDDIFPTPERVTLPRRNPFDEYDEKKFKERFRLSKSVVRRLLDEVTNSRHITIERRHVKWEGSGSDEVNINRHGGKPIKEVMWHFSDNVTIISTFVRIVI